MKPAHHITGRFDDHSNVGETRPGSCAYDATSDTYTITGAGANIWGDHDAFHFVWKRMRGDFIVTMRAYFEGKGVHDHRKLGWMARASLDIDAAHASTGIHGDGLVSLQFRRTAGAQTEEAKAAISGGDVVQLERRGPTWIMSVAHFGEPFTSVEVPGLDLGDEVYLGIFVCSHDDEVIEEARFQDVRIVVPVAKGFDRGRDPFGSRLELLDVESGRRTIVKETDDVLEAPNWMRDGKALIYNAGGRLHRFDLASHDVSPIDTGSVVHNNNDHVLSFDGTMLAISSHDAAAGGSLVYTVPVTGGEPYRVTPVGPSYLHGWSPDGAYVVYTAMRNGDFDVYRMAATGGDEERLTTAVGLDDGPEYTPDGEYIYFNSVRSGSMQVWRMRPDGSNQEQLTNDEYNNWFPHISPDGQSVAMVSYLPGEVDPSDHPAAKRVYLRVMPRDGGAPRVVAYLYGGQGTMNVPSWSPDGKRLAFVTNTVPFR